MREPAVLVAVLGAATAFGVFRRLTDGRLKRREHGDQGRLTGTDLGAPLGERATIVQFSTPYCQVCRPTRILLQEIADSVAGVTFVDVPAQERLPLVRRLGILRAPVVLVLDGQGNIVRRGQGQPSRAEVVQAVNEVV